MKSKICILILASGLIACGGSGHSRYKDTAILEKPPILALQKTQQNAVIDDSVEPKKQLGGLDEKVILLDEKPQKLLLKLPVMDAWRVLGTALRQSDIKVTDYDKNKHLYYVSYKSQGILKNIFSSLNEEDTQAVYVMMLESQNGETVIHASLANNNEQRSQNTDENIARPTDDSDGLMESIYHLLRDDVKTE
ncbi:MAG: outer membrane protein assembly factor BamC [Methylococcales bacterium]|nr:outer membrane protein assembly factor BamC [Methylococcales bacterium]